MLFWLSDAREIWRREGFIKSDLKRRQAELLKKVQEEMEEVKEKMSLFDIFEAFLYWEKLKTGTKSSCKGDKDISVYYQNIGGLITKLNELQNYV